MIGAGVFGATGGFAYKLGSGTDVLLVWFFCGGLALAGALSLGELAGMMPQAGGCYVFNREIYGRTAGYLSGVLSMLLAFVGALAFIALLLGHHVAVFAPEIPPAATAAVAIATFSLIHCMGLAWGTRVNNTFTIFKLGVLVAFIIAGLCATPAAAPIVAPAAGWPGVFSSTFAAAMVSASFAYMGWETTTFISSEVRRPERNVPLSLLAGTLIVTATYLLINFVYLRALAPQEMSHTVEGVQTGIYDVGLRAAQRLFTGDVSTWFNVMILVVLLSTISTVTMVGARVLLAMSQAGQLPAGLTQLNTRAVPARALLVQGAVTLLFIAVARDFRNADTLLQYIGMPLTVVMGAAVLGVIILRRRDPSRVRPFRVPLYPLPPLLFGALSLWMVISSVRENRAAALASAVTIVLLLLLKPLLCRKAD